MNRQAIAFLTMFSLVLMLAVYYITMPIQQTDEQTPVVSTPNAFEQLKLELTSKRQSLLDSYTAIMASSTSSSQEKAVAMEQMNALNTIINDEKVYLDIIQKLGYENCYLEIEKDVIRVNVQKEDFETNDASKIIKTILVHSNYQYVPEVSFSK